MCPEAEELFEEYYAALEAPDQADRQKYENRLRRAIRMLSIHNASHGCCVSFRFELTTPAGSVWKFSSLPGAEHYATGEQG